MNERLPAIDKAAFEKAKQDHYQAKHDELVKKFTEREEMYKQNIPPPDIAASIRKTMGLNEATPFTKLLYRMQEVHDRKGKDYEPDAIPYQNHRAAERVGIPAWKYPLMRMMEKFSRVESFCKRGHLATAEEDFDELMIDIANLALIANILYSEKTNGNDNQAVEKVSSAPVPAVQKSESQAV